MVVKWLEFDSLYRKPNNDYQYVFASKKNNGSKQDIIKGSNS
jgi:hypothetical protein